jgi:hypothetical protein
MTSWFGFVDPYLPLAAYETWNYYGTTVLPVTGATVNDSAQYVLSQMYCFASFSSVSTQGTCGQDAVTGMSVWDIICCGWGNANSVSPCQESYCETDLTTQDYVNSLPQGIQGGVQGGFLGNMAGLGGAGAGIGFLAMAGVSFGLSIW